MVATTHVLKVTNGNIVNPIHTLANIDEGLTLIQMLLELMDDDGKNPRLPLYYVEKLIQECEFLGIEDPRLVALNHNGNGQRSILTEDQEVDIKISILTNQFLYTPNFQGQLFFELVGNLEGFMFMSIGTSIRSVYDVINCPQCGKTVNEGQTTLETKSPCEMAPVVYIPFPQQGVTLEALIREEFEKVQQGIEVNCRDTSVCKATGIGRKSTTRILEYCPGAMIVSVQRRDDQTGARMFQALDIGNDTVTIYPSTPEEVKLRLVACMEHTLIGGNTTI